MKPSPLPTGRSRPLLWRLLPLLLLTPLQGDVLGATRQLCPSGALLHTMNPQVAHEIRMYLDMWHASAKTEWLDRRLAAADASEASKVWERAGIAIA